ncbi:MAG: hypothetical protein Kow0069_03320 [Promethearchaeota archaeon]
MFGPFSFLQSLSREFISFLLLNSVKALSKTSDGGLVLYRFCRDHPGVPQTKIYRALCAMEGEGWVTKQKKEVGGRTVHAYRLTDAGEAKVLEMKANLNAFFNLLRERFPAWLTSPVDVEGLTFAQFRDPLQKVVVCRAPVQQKILTLRKIRRDLEAMLGRVEEEIKKLEADREREV